MHGQKNIKKRNVSIVYVCSGPNCCDAEQQSASQPGWVASGTPYIFALCVLQPNH